VKGIVFHNAVETGQQTPIGGAEIGIVSGGTGKIIRTTLLGEYWRLLPPGHYTVSLMIF
jgi:hypothetical protein